MKPSSSSSPDSCPSPAASPDFCHAAGPSDSPVPWLDQSPPEAPSEPPPDFHGSDPPAVPSSPAEGSPFHSASSSSESAEPVTDTPNPAMRFECDGPCCSNPEYNPLLHWRSSL